MLNVIVKPNSHQKKRPPFLKRLAVNLSIILCSLKIEYLFHDKRYTNPKIKNFISQKGGSFCL